MITVMMDLQGTLGGDPLGDITNFYFYENTIEGLKILEEMDCRKIIITNQSRIGKGFITEESYNEKLDKVLKEIKKEGITLDEVYCCPHTKEDNCECKKPKIGLVSQANNTKEIDMSKCYVIGDMGISDMVLADNIGAKKILVLTGAGKGSLGEFRNTWSNIGTDYIAIDLLDAVKWIQKYN